MADVAQPPAAPHSNSFFQATKMNAQAAYNSMAKGPVAQNVMNETAKTSSEFSNLAAARKTPDQPAATGQALTHYHSFFSELLSWKNPRASAIAYASIVTFIFLARYLDIIRYAFKLSWMALGITVAAEASGQFLLNKGLASQMRPAQYYTVPRQTIDNMIGDVHELINFFVIEAQRILYAENLSASAAVAFSAFLSYYMVRLVPYWGLAIIATTATFFVPLVYTSNQQLIDQHLKNASEIVTAQTAQVREVAQKQAGQIGALSKQYAGDYTGKVQEFIRNRTASGGKPPAEKTAAAEPVPQVKEAALPSPPTEEPVKPAAEVPTPEVPEESDAGKEEEPMIAS